MLLVPRRKLIGLGAGALATPFVLRRAEAQDFLTGVGTKKGSGNAGTPAFTPDRLIGQYGMFYRADVGVTQSAGNVSAWADQGPYGFGLTSSSNRPAWSSTKFNATHPGVGFGAQSGFGNSNSDSAATSNSVFWSTTCSFFLGLTLGSTLVANSIIAFFFNQNSPAVATGPSGNGYGFQLGNLLLAGQDASSGILGNGGAYVTVTTGSPQMLGTIANGSVANTYIGQTAQGAAVPYTGTIGYPRLSGPVNLGYGFGCPNMVLAWVLMTDRALSAADISNLASWSNSTFGTSF